MDATEQKISELVERYSDMIYRLALSYMKSIHNAEDVVQDVFLKLVENDIFFDNPEHEKAWIIRVTINICKNKLRQFWNRNTTALDDVQEPSYSDTYEDDTVLKAVMSLPENYRIVIHLFYYEGYKTPELAKLLKKRESSIRSILHRAREQLKTILKEEYDFE